MNYSFIQFHHFFTKESYCELQKYFLSFDENSYAKRSDEPIEDLEIVYKTVDVFSGIETYDKLKFYEDFVYKETSKLAEKQFLKFQKEIKNKGIYADDALNNFVKKYISKKREYSEDISLAKYLPIRFIASLLLELDKLEELIEGYLQDPDPHFKEKISFNWTRSSVILFFHLLRKNKIIQWMEDRDIAKVIDYSFQYSSGKEYLPIKDSRKMFGNYRRDEKIPDASIKNIKEDLLKPDFFE